MGFRFIAQRRVRACTHRAKGDWLRCLKAGIPSKQDCGNGACPLLRNGDGFETGSRVQQGRGKVKR